MPVGPEFHDSVVSYNVHETPRRLSPDEALAGSRGERCKLPGVTDGSSFRLAVILQAFCNALEESDQVVTVSRPG